MKITKKVDVEININSINRSYCNFNCGMIFVNNLGEIYCKRYLVQLEGKRFDCESIKRCSRCVVEFGYGEKE